MGDDQEIMHVPIGGDWYAHEMIELIATIEEHYSDFVLLYKILDLQKEQKASTTTDGIKIGNQISQIKEALFSDQEESRIFVTQTDWLLDSRLRVRRIFYGSEGGWDLLGIGKAIKAASDFVLGVLNFAGTKEDRRKKCLENAKAAIELAKEGGASEANIRNMTAKALKRCGYLFDLKDQQKLLPPPKPEGQRP